MEVVEVGGEAKSLDGSLDISLDVRRRVGDASVAKNVESALGGDFRSLALAKLFMLLITSVLTYGRPCL